MIVLGIETSCDETAVGIVRDGRELLANAVVSSMDLHAAFGGVVPEIAARSHIEVMTPVIREALSTAFPGTSEEEAWAQIDAIAVAYGPGLGGSLLVGVTAARTLAMSKNKPLYGVNHVIAHAYASFLTETSLDNYVLPEKQPVFPMLALTVAGGHSQLTLYRDHFDYQVLGRTRDDAVGEAFDKAAKILGLPYPGGPSITKAATAGDPYAYNLPKAKLTSKTPRNSGSDAMQGDGEKRSETYKHTMKRVSEPSTQQSAENTSSAVGSARGQAGEASDSRYEWSFSGLKTAVLRLAQELIGEDFTFPSYKLPERLSETQKADIAASFQRVAIETIVDKVVAAHDEFQPASFVVGGGVAASQELRWQLNERLPSPPDYTDIKLCTDNGAMIATLGCYHAELGQPESDTYSLSIEPNLSM